MTKFIANTQRGFEISNRKQLRLLAKLENKARSASSMLTVLQAKLAEVDTEQKGMTEVAKKMRKKKKILDIVTKSATKANVILNDDSSEDEDSDSSDHDEEEMNIPHYAIVSDSDQDTEPNITNADEQAAAPSTPVIQEEGGEVELVDEVNMNTST